MKNNIAVKERTVVESVMNRVAEMETEGIINFPEKYSYKNAITSAKLILMQTVDKNGKNVLDSCSKESIANSLLDMVVQGLNPVKKQGYFIAYGGKCQFQRSYFGTIALAKRFSNIKDIRAYALFDGDVFKTKYNTKTGILEVEEYTPSFNNINSGKVVGAFAVVIGAEGIVHTEVMNFAQLEQSWKQSYGYAKSATHKNFREEMAKKTVINRALKLFVNTSDDSDLLIESFNNDFNQTEYVEAEAVEVENIEEANTEAIDIEDEPVAEEQEVISEEQEAGF